MLDYGVKPDDLFVEVVSGVSKRRPRLEEAIAKCDAGDTFVVWKLDRFSRSLMDLLRRVEYFEEHKIGFVSMTEQFDTRTSMGRCIVSVIGALAQLERDMIAERTRAGIQHKIKTEGYRPGPTPVLDQFEGRPRKMAKAMRKSGKTVPEIRAAIENEFGIKVSLKTLYNQTAVTKD